MKIKLGFSPCPNDTFIFDAMIHHKVDTEGLEFDVFFDDVETLNQKAFKQEADVTKLSFHAYAYAVENYVLLNSGSALGFGVGPLVIAKDPKWTSKWFEATRDPEKGQHYFQQAVVAYPGRFTTANFLFGLAFPTVSRKKELVFSEIEEALLKENADLGLIIHENRFTYEDKGLHKVVDLGDFWERTTGSPIPLGGIVVKRSFSQELKEKIDRVIRKSVEYAFENPSSGIEFIRSHAQAMREEVMYKHIELYVNDYSVDLGNVGRTAVKNLFKKGTELGLTPITQQELFLTNYGEKTHV